MSGLGRFSIIIVTCNRRRTLDLCLSQIARQSLGPHSVEVLVVDDGSTDGTQEWLCRSAWPFPLRAFSTGNSTDRFGVMRGRNIALLQARGEIAFFLDDDLVLHPDAMTHIAAVHDRWDAKSISVAVRGWFGQRRKKGTLHLWWRSLTLSRYRPERERRRSARFRELETRREDLDPRQAPIGMLSVPVSAACKVDGFPEQVAAWGMDYEFQERLKSMAGVRFIFEPRAYGLHGPLRGDMTNKAYRRPLEAAPNLPRRGLSSYNAGDMSRFVLHPANRVPDRAAS